MKSTVPIELKFEVPLDMARALTDMGERADGGLAAVMTYALALYVTLDQNIWPGDSFWILRGNEHVKLHILLPARPGTEKSAAPADPDDGPKPKKITIPEGWTVHPGGKQD